MEPLSPNAVFPDQDNLNPGSDERRESEPYGFFRWSKSTWRRLTEHSLNGLQIASDDFFVLMRWPLVLGKVFGLIPIQGLLANDLNDILFKWRSLTTVYTITVTAFAFIVSLFSFKEFLKTFFGFQRASSSTKRLILETREPLILLAASFIYLTFLLKAEKIIRFAHRWRLSSKSLTYKNDEKQTGKLASATLVVLIVPGLMVTNLLQLHDVGIFGNSFTGNESLQYMNTTLWEMYYMKYSSGLTEFISYNPVFTGLLFAIKNFASFAYLFSDACIICMSLLLYTRFQGVYDQARVYSTIPQRKISYSYSMFRKTSLERIMKQNIWIEIRRNHLICMHLFWEAEDILSPLVFLSYALSSYLVSVQIHESVILSATTIPKALVSWLALAYFLGKLIFLSVSASKIHYYAHAILSCIRNCPHSSYSLEVERLEYFLTTKTVGLSGFGCFVVTKAFLLSVASVVFTFEIILFSSPK